MSVSLFCVSGFYTFIHFIKETYNTLGGEGRGHLERRPPRRDRCFRGGCCTVWVSRMEARSIRVRIVTVPSLSLGTCVAFLVLAPCL